ncbi:MAG: hypothetical protein LLG02_16905 [Pelosinus sp.]|nr:hypothetical protein [Pelosinus sp.]
MIKLQLVERLDNMKCVECNAEVPHGWLRCAECGHSIEGVKWQGVMQQEESSNIRFHSVDNRKIILLLVAVFFICSAIYFKYNNEACFAQNKIDVEFGIEPEQKNGQLEIRGRTNLPDGTDLVMVLSNNSYASESKVRVLNGSFSKQFSMDGKRLEVGLYNLQISVSTVMQDEAIQKRIGKHGEMLSGAFVAKSPGNIVNYAKTVQVD